MDRAIFSEKQEYYLGCCSLSNVTGDQLWKLGLLDIHLKDRSQTHIEASG